MKPWFENKSYKYKKKYNDEELEETIEEKKKQSFFKKALTPKNVEEVRPGFFIKSFPKNLDTIEYRQVHPLVWDGKWRLKNQIKIKNILMIVLIIALYFGAVKYIRFYEEVNADPKTFCRNVSILNSGEVMHEDSSSLPSNLGEVEWNIP